MTLRSPSYVHQKQKVNLHMHKSEAFKGYGHYLEDCKYNLTDSHIT